MNHVIEIVLFRLNEGVSETEFLDKAQATFDLLASWDGYLHRELTASVDGQWVDIVHWESLETAQAAAEKIMSHEIGQAFGACIAPHSINMQHVVPKISTIETERS